MSLLKYDELNNLDLSLLGGPRLAEVGKIKIGGKGKKVTSKKGAQFRVPEKYDHFVVTTSFKDPRTDDFVADTALMARIAEQSGQDPAKLRFIPVTLLFDDPDLNFQVRFSCYAGNQAWCIGDGTKALRLKNDKERETIECPCERVLPAYKGQNRCKVFGRLSVILQCAERLGGVWVFRTTSWNTTRNILSSMMLLKQITGGVLAGLPLLLTIQPKTVVTQDGQSQVVYVVNIEYSGTIEDLTRKALDIKRQRTEYKVQVELLEDQARQRLLSMPDVDEEEARDIRGEFYPENGVPQQEMQQAAEPEGEAVPQEGRPAEKDQPADDSAADAAPTESPEEAKETETGLSGGQEAGEWAEGEEFEQIDPSKVQQPAPEPPEPMTLWK